MNLFEKYDLQPDYLREIVQRHEQDDYTYEDCEKLLAEVEAVGYTFEYGLDALPFGLKRKGSNTTLNAIISCYSVDEIDQHIDNTSYEFFCDELESYTREDKINLINDLYNSEEV